MTERHRISEIDVLLPVCHRGRNQRVEEIEYITKKCI